MRADSQAAKELARHVDPNLAELTGEASQQAVDGGAQTPGPQTWTLVPTVCDDDPTYYDLPLLKAPVWKADIPAYYYLGGAAGAAFVLGAMVRFAKDPGLRDLSRHCHWIGVTGSTLGAGLLVHDLGRPARFLNMMRVFRPTSPMNMGVWILSAAAPLGVASAFFAQFRGGRLGLIEGVSTNAAGAFGAMLATYTGVLVGNSAIPLWQQMRRVLPFLFAGSAMTSAASLCEIFGEQGRGARIVFRFGTVGRLIELTAGFAAEHSVGKIPRVARPLREGATGSLWRGAAVFTAASLVVSLLPGKSRKKQLACGILGTLGSICLRFAVHYAGARSARDSRASFQQQRAGFGAAEVTGSPALTGSREDGH